MGILVAFSNNYPVVIYCVKGASCKVQGLLDKVTKLLNNLDTRHAVCPIPDCIKACVEKKKKPE